MSRPSFGAAYHAYYFVYLEASVLADTVKLSTDLRRGWKFDCVSGQAIGWILVAVLTSFTLRDVDISGLIRQFPTTQSNYRHVPSRQSWRQPHATVKAAVWTLSNTALSYLRLEGRSPPPYVLGTADVQHADIFCYRYAGLYGGWGRRLASCKSTTCSIKSRGSEFCSI
jgi:hypothetical protein